MYFTQGASTFLFTILRLILQLSSILLLSHLASRDYSLTYQERINGGFISGIRYLFFTRFRTGRKHYRGRIYVALALFISVALNYLPTFLSNQFPVKPTYGNNHLQKYDPGMLFSKVTAQVQPGKSAVEDLLVGLGVPLNGSLFSHYTGSFPSVIPCRHVLEHVWVIYCGKERLILSSNLPFENKTYYYGYMENAGKKARKAKDPQGNRFEYFNVSQSGNQYAMAEMYANVAQAKVNNLYTDLNFRGPSNMEGCFIRPGRPHRCARHTHGYFWVGRADSVMTITRRSFTTTHSFAINQTLTLPLNGTKLDPRLNTTIDCQLLPTPTLEQMCRQLNSVRPEFGRSFTNQKRTRADNASTHWDVLNFYIGLGSRGVKGFAYPSLIMESFHLEVDVSIYKCKHDEARFFSNTKSRLREVIQLAGQEVFETVRMEDLPEDEHDHSWIQHGFTNEDLQNMTSFILGGTFLNNGTIILKTPILLADVPAVVIISLIVASLLMISVGFAASKDSPLLTRNPLTEVFPAILESKQVSNNKGRTSASYWQLVRDYFRVRQVSNIILAPQVYNITGDSHSTSTAVYYRLYIENENDDASGFIQLEDTMDGRASISSQQSMTPML
ncbi:hypothetical protein BGW38_002623 [Lunasporangiospora selenospora]|uniref:Uncharacterized protein n=1 Tax=Lunasporangiospora selenospora TaxID=979761 RepID=A0A9P6KDF0_9FUNG|nr:hypothetical protein BGW38_002623 [Lunasporangiospora selenospora]